MTDIYVRRADDPDPRRRGTLLLLVVVLLAAGGFGVYRFGCQRSSKESDDLAGQVRSDSPPVELIDLAEPESSAPPLRLPVPSPSPTAPEPPAEPASPPAETIATSEPASPPPEAIATSETPGGDPGIRLFTEARERFAEGALLEAREKALAVLQSSQNDAARTRAADLLGEVGIQLVLTPRSMPEKVEYVVQPGDSLARLAKKFNTTIDLIQKSNNISGTVIRVGDRMRILNTPFRAEIDKSSNILDLYLGDHFFKRYQVGTGEYNRTPVGDFKITDRIAQPTWWRPDGKAIPFGSPENELGTHWLSLDVRGYGLHGTWEPETIGHQASAGCVRLINEEIEELYTLLPLDTAVSIHD